MYLLDYILPQVAKLSRALQTKHLDLSLISSLVDDAVLPSENWVLQLQDAREELKAARKADNKMYALFKKEWASLLSYSSKITYPAGLDPPQKMWY